MIEIAYVIVGCFIALVAGGCALFGGGTGLTPETPENPICKFIDKGTAKAVEFHEKYQK